MFNWMFETKATKELEKFNIGQTEIRIHLDNFGKTTKSWFITGRLGRSMFDERIYADLSIDIAKRYYNREAETGLIEISKDVYVPLDKVFKIEYITEDYFILEDGSLVE